MDYIGLADTALSFLSGFGSPDDSQNWTANDWWWYIWKDPATHPAQNGLLYFSKNPNFWDVPTTDPNTGHVLSTKAERIQKARERFSTMGYGEQFDKIIQSQGLNNSTGASSFSSTLRNLGGIANLFGGQQNSPFANLADVNSQPKKSSSLLPIAGIVLVAGFIFRKRLKKMFS